MHPTHPACALVCEGFPPGGSTLFICHFSAFQLWLLWPLRFIQEPVRASQPVSSLHLRNGRPSASKVCQVHFCWNVLPSNPNLAGGFCYLSHSVGHKHFPCLCGSSQPIQRNNAVHPNSSITDGPTLQSTMQVLRHVCCHMAANKF